MDVLRLQRLYGLRIRDDGYWLMSYYLDIEVKQAEGGIFISQEAYWKSILNKFNMEKCNPVSTPVDCGIELSKHDEGSNVDPTYFKSLVGSLC